MPTLTLPPIRSVGPSGHVAAEGAQAGAYELAQARSGFGAALEGMGGEMESVAKRIKEQRLKEQEYRADMDLTQLRQDAQLDVRNWRKTSHLTDKGEPAFWPDMEKVRQTWRQKRDDYAKGMDPDVAKRFQVTSDRHLEEMDNHLYNTVKQHEQDYYVTTVPERIKNRYRMMDGAGGAQEWAAFIGKNPDVLSLEEQSKIEDEFLEQEIYGAMEQAYQSPELIDGMIDAADIPNEMKDKLRRDWSGNQEARRIQRERQDKEQLQANDAKATVSVLRTLRGVAQPDETMSPSRLEDLMEQRVISRERGESLWDRMTKPKPSDRDTRLKSYGVLSKARRDFKLKRIDRTQFDALYNAEQGNVDEEDAEAFQDAANNVEVTQYDQLSDEAAKMTKEALTPIFATDELDPQTFKPITDPRLDVAEGDVADRIDKWAASRFKSGEPIDRKTFMEGAIQIIGQVREEYQPTPTKPEKKGKKKAPAEVGPATREEFLQQVARLKATDRQAARKYYDKWSGHFSGK